MGEGVTGANGMAWTCLSVHCLGLGSHDLVYQLLLSTGQMDDVLDYICPLHHSRDVHRHLPLLVSAPGTGMFQRAAFLVNYSIKIIQVNFLDELPKSACCVRH